MQLILDTVPVIREEDRQELLKVMPSFVGQGWEVKRSLRKLLPEVEDKGKMSIYFFKICDTVIHQQHYSLTPYFRH